jgi:glycosyltransferase involved in cell wall biosynthesis
MSHALQDANNDIHYIGNLKRKTEPFFKIKQAWNKYVCNQRTSPRFNEVVAKHYSEQVAKQLAMQPADAIVSPLINPIAYLDSNKPVVLWTDALYSALVGFYPPFNFHSASTIHQGNTITQNCLSRVSLAIFSSDWAANSAIELYGMSKDKVRVVPFGANIVVRPTLNDVRQYIQARSHHKIKLLFLAKSWERKGGDIVLAVAKKLHESGHPVELTIVGYTPPNLEQHAAYVRCLGYISKHTPQGRERIQQILAESHFLFVPSRAEAYGIVFCEANAFGVPCLTTHVGGIGTVVKDNVNGMTFGLDAPIDTYCTYIVNALANRETYQQLALASFNEFETRLNWGVAAGNVAKMIREIA